MMKVDDFAKLISVESMNHCKILADAKILNLPKIEGDFILIVEKLMLNTKSAKNRITFWEILMTGAEISIQLESRLFDFYDKNLLRLDFSMLDDEDAVKVFKSFWFKSDALIEMYLEKFKEVRGLRPEIGKKILFLAQNWKDILSARATLDISLSFDAMSFSDEFEQKYYVPKTSRLVRQVWISSLVNFCKENNKKFIKEFDENFFSPVAGNILTESHFNLINTMSQTSDFRCYYKNKASLDSSLRFILRTKHSNRALYSVLDPCVEASLRRLYNREKFDEIFSRHATGDDVARKVFWKNYVDEMYDIHYSPYPNNILIMEFANTLAVEFLDASNACFFYDKSALRNSTTEKGKRLMKAYALLMDVTYSMTDSINVTSDTYRKIADKIEKSVERITASTFKIQPDVKNPDPALKRWVPHIPRYTERNPGWHIKFHQYLKNDGVKRGEF